MHVPRNKAIKMLLGKRSNSSLGMDSKGFLEFNNRLWFPLGQGSNDNFMFLSKVHNFSEWALPKLKNDDSVKEAPAHCRSFLEGLYK